MARHFTLLISSVGRRGQLVECFRQAGTELGIELLVLGADAEPDLAPASRLVDRCFRVPRCSDPQFTQELLALSKHEHVDLIVPTIDPELPVYARHRPLFEADGIEVLISGPQTIDIASDKLLTNRWLVQHGYPTVRQATVDEVLRNRAAWEFPVIVKPRCGSASVGVRFVNEAATLQLLAAEPGLVVESVACGVEHTTNVLVNSSRKCLCAVPHQRLETRGGEVSKGRTVKNRRLMELVRSVVEALPDAYGPLNVQGFVAKNGEIQLTEINARFGGGFPLAAQAGANFCRWILEDAFDLPSTAAFSDWKEHLLMLRFDNAVFIEQRGEVI